MRATGIFAAPPTTRGWFAFGLESIFAGSWTDCLAGRTAVRLALVRWATRSTMLWITDIQLETETYASGVADRLADDGANRVGAVPLTAGIVAEPAAFRMTGERKGEKGEEEHYFSLLVQT
jgi:hypothetical protein